jgi:hypothetical protein
MMNPLSIKWASSHFRLLNFYSYLILHDTVRGSSETVRSAGKVAKLMNVKANVKRRVVRGIHLAVV